MKRHTPQRVRGKAMTTNPIKLIRKQANSLEFSDVTQERVAYKLDGNCYLVYLPNQEAEGCLYFGRWSDILARYDVVEAHSTES